MAFILADGREITVVKGWRGEPAEQEFLREVFTGACQTFSTVLGPGSDPFHYDHIHLDLARHDPRGARRICQPVLKFEPRLDPRVASRPLQAQPASGLQPLDVDTRRGNPDRTGPLRAGRLRRGPSGAGRADRSGETRDPDLPAAHRGGPAARAAAAHPVAARALLIGLWLFLLTGRTFDAAP